MKIYVIILLFIPMLSSAQSKAYDAVIGFRNFKPEPFQYEYTLCPWQSFRFIPYLSYQIDLICDSVSLQVLQQDDHLFVEALEYVYRCYPLNIYNNELIRRWDSSPGRYKIHIPGLLAPRNKYYQMAYVSDALNITRQGYGGWIYQTHRSGIGYAVKELGPNQFQVSAAMFLRAVTPEAVAYELIKMMFL